MIRANTTTCPSRWRSRWCRLAEWIIIQPVRTARPPLASTLMPLLSATAHRLRLACCVGSADSADAVMLEQMQLEGTGISSAGASLIACCAVMVLKTVVCCSQRIR